MITLVILERERSFGEKDLREALVTRYEPNYSCWKQDSLQRSPTLQISFIEGKTRNLTNRSFEPRRPNILDLLGDTTLSLVRVQNLLGSVITVTRLGLVVKHLDRTRSWQESIVTASTTITHNTTAWLSKTFGIRKTARVRRNANHNLVCRYTESQHGFNGSLDRQRRVWDAEKVTVMTSGS